jgi:hypothetical protein
MRERTLLNRRIKSARKKAERNRARHRPGDRRRNSHRLTPYVRPQQPSRYCLACAGPAGLHTAAGCETTHRRGYYCTCRREQATPVSVVAANRAAVGVDRLTVTVGPISGRGRLIDRLDWDSLARLQAAFPDIRLVDTAVARAALALVRDVA